MTPEIAGTLIILLFAVLLFVSERIRMDLVALLVLGSLAVTSLVTPAEALSGFSNPAVVTVWAVFILSAGLARTGVAKGVGRQVLRFSGRSEIRLILVIMLTAGVMSAFMNNVGVAALLLPVVMDISRQTGRAPSRLLMPLAIGALLGGLTTLIGTPPNILISDALRDAGLDPFQLFDYAPVGVVVMLVGILFVILVGRYLLPMRDPTREETARAHPDLEDLYGIEERLFVLHIPQGSALDGRTLVESRLGLALGVNVIAITRHGNAEELLAPAPSVILHAGDRLLVQGRTDQLVEIQDQPYLTVEEEQVPVDQLTSQEIRLAEVSLSSQSSLIGKTLAQINFRRRYGLNVLAIWRNGTLRRTDLQDLSLQLGNILLLQGPGDRLAALQDDPDFLLSAMETAHIQQLHERLVAMRVPENSALVGRTLLESRLGHAFDLVVLSIVRQGQTRLMPAPEEKLEAGDLLLVEGKPEDLRTLHGLQDLEVEQQPVSAPQEVELESERVGLAEVVLSPRNTLAGKTLREIHFREKYDLTVLAIWRNGRAYRSHLGIMPLQFGDALLVHGPRHQLTVLGSEPDFLVLTEAAQEEPRLQKAPLAVLIMAGVLATVIVGWLPIAVAAVVGAAVMVLTRCLTMDEAYRAIEWRAVFLIAGMLPLGIAMQNSGAADFLAEGVVRIVGPYGPLAVIAGLYLLATLATQVMPNPAVAVLLAPIALNTAATINVSPYTLMMAVAVAASASFLSPVAHPANVLVMGPGGYRFADYLKVGIPLTLAVLAVVLLVLPVVWPLY
jgi:di/tricarboxylate transporter